MRTGRASLILRQTISETTPPAGSSASLFSPAHDCADSPFSQSQPLFASNEADLLGLLQIALSSMLYPHLAVSSGMS